MYTRSSIIYSYATPRRVADPWLYTYTILLLLYGQKTEFVKPRWQDGTYNIRTHCALHGLRPYKICCSVPRSLFGRWPLALHTAQDLYCYIFVHNNNNMIRLICIIHVYAYFIKYRLTRHCPAHVCSSSQFRRGPCPHAMTIYYYYYYK